jgi:hypothetical protein
MARYAAELMSRGCPRIVPPNGQYVSALDSVMGSLLTTEGTGAGRGSSWSASLLARSWPR